MIDWNELFGMMHLIYFGGFFLFFVIATPFLYIKTRAQYPYSIDRWFFAGLHAMLCALVWPFTLPIFTMYLILRTFVKEN